MTGNIGIRAAKKYFGAVQNFARLRESAFRYAAYLHYRDEFDAGKSLQEIGYGASPPWMVEGITDVRDKAAKMARDLLGDYGAIPYRAKWARQRMIPFVSWIASNTTRYVNLFRNAYLTGRDISTQEGLARGTFAAAGLTVRMFMFYTVVQLWNNLLFGDEEDELGSEERLRMHAILGRWDGEIVTMRFQGAMSDFLGWFGFEDAGALISEIHSGRASFGDVIGSIIKAPANRLVQGVTPLYKLPLELALGQQYFPDFFNPRGIRDRTRHAAQTFSLAYPTAMAQKIFGKSAPTRSPLRIAAGILAYSRDPGQIAYDTLRGKAFEFIKRTTGKSLGGHSGPKGQALYNLRQARRLGDTWSEDLARKELAKYPNWGESLASSMRSASPLGMFPSNQLRGQFLRTLSPKERDQLARATQWFNRTVN